MPGGFAEAFPFGDGTADESAELRNPAESGTGAFMSRRERKHRGPPVRPESSGNAPDDKLRLSVALSSRLARSESILFTALEDVIVMLDIDRGAYFELDAIGSRIWHLLEPEPLVRDLLPALMAEYDVEADTCREDLIAFLEELLTLGLVKSEPESPDGA